MIKKIMTGVASMLLIFAATMNIACARNLDDVNTELADAKAKQASASSMANHARALGLNEDSETIVVAQQFWWEAQNAIEKLSPEKQKLEAQKAAEEKKKAEAGSKRVYIGKFRISHYCPCATCNGRSDALTASGARMTPNYTIAVDTSVIPLGSTVFIEGYGNLKAQDTGGAIKGNRIDVCVSSHAEAYRRGVVYKDVYIVK